ncbi:MAG: aldose 1-epimerase family protein [Actinomycetota bacterium]
MHRATPTPPTGRQVTLRHGKHEVVTVAVAAGLRTYTVADRPLIDGFAEDEVPFGARGHTLVPWPNRIADGRYEFDGPQQLPLTEPDRRTAIHGLAQWVCWDAEKVRTDLVVWRYDVVPQPGWPTTLECRVEYRVGADGLTVRTSARNVGARPCLYGTGAHPYLTTGASRINDASLIVPAATWFPTDERGLPTEGQSVTDTRYDLRTREPLGEKKIDHAYGGLSCHADGGWAVQLMQGGAGVELWADAAYRFVQIFTGDVLAPDQARRGVAVEPMTCLPDAFNASDRAAAGVVTLGPGDEHIGTWGLRPC